MNKLILLTILLFSSSTFASLIPTCEYTSLKGSAFFGAIKVQIELTKKAETENSNYLFVVKSKLPGKKVRYDVSSSINTDNEITYIQRVKYQGHSTNRELSRNDLTYFANKNSYVLRKKKSATNEPYYYTGEIIKKDHSLDLTGVIFYLRSLDLAKINSPFYIYLLGPKGSIDSQGRPKQYSRMRFDVSNSSKRHNVRVTLDPLPTDDTPEDGDQYEYLIFSFNTNEAKTINSITLKGSGKPKMKFKVNKYKILPSC